MLHNVTGDYFHSQVFWFFVSFMVIYISFSWFLQPAIEHILSSRLKNRDNMNDKIDDMKNLIQDYKFNLHSLKKKLNDEISQLRNDFNQEAQEITDKYKAEYNVERSKLESEMMVKIKKFVDSNDYGNLKKLVVQKVQSLLVEK